MKKAWILACIVLTAACGSSSSSQGTGGSTSTTQTGTGGGTSTSSTGGMGTGGSDPCNGSSGQTCDAASAEVHATGSVGASQVDLSYCGVLDSFFQSPTGTTAWGAYEALAIEGASSPESLFAAAFGAGEFDSIGTNQAGVGLLRFIGDGPEQCTTFCVGAGSTVTNQSLSIDFHAASLSALGACPGTASTDTLTLNVQGNICTASGTIAAVSIAGCEGYVTVQGSGYHTVMLVSASEKLIPFVFHAAGGAAGTPAPVDELFVVTGDGSSLTAYCGGSATTVTFGTDQVQLTASGLALRGTCPGTATAGTVDIKAN